MQYSIFRNSLVRSIAPVVVLIMGLLFSSRAYAQANEQFIVENYYRVKWGYAEEFIQLWKLNHYPLLKEAIKKGDIISVVAEKPKLHSGEDTRWDFRVTLVFKNAKLAFDPELTTPYKEKLYPNQGKLIKDEQHRFELLLSHWDVMVDAVPLQ